MSLLRRPPPKKCPRRISRRNQGAILFSGPRQQSRVRMFQAAKRRLWGAREEYTPVLGIIGSCGVE